MKIAKKTFLLLGMIFVMSGCGLISPFTSPMEKRGVKGFLNDNVLHMRLRRAFSHQKFHGIEILVHRGQVVLAGRVVGQAQKDAAELVAENTKGIKHVFNDLEVGGDERTVLTASDILMSQKAQAKLFFDLRVASRNYHIVVVDRVLYVIGTARSDTEKANVLRHCRSLKGVRRIGAHIEVEPDMPSAKS